MAFWPSDRDNRPLRSYEKRYDPRAEQLEREYDVWYKRADRLLKILEAWEQDIKLTLADCNRQCHEAEYTKNLREAVRKIRELNEDLEALDEQMRECGLRVAPRKKYGWKSSS